MQKPFIIITLIAILSIGALYSLPKVVVNDEKKTLEQPQKEATTVTANRDKGVKDESPTSPEMHSSKLTSKQQAIIDDLKGKFKKNTEKQAKIKSAENFVSAFY